MSVLDNSFNMTLAEAKAIIKNLEKENEELKQHLSNERTITHNASFYDNMRNEYQCRVLSDELISWRNIGHKILSVIEGDPNWDVVKKLIYADENAQREFDWKLEGVPARNRKEALVNIGVNATIERSMQEATKTVNKVVAEYKKDVEEARQREIEKNLDRSIV